MHTPTILCVDDERNVLLTLRTQLMRHFPAYKVEIAETGDEALALVNALIAKDIEIPLAIVDQDMPDVQNGELLIELHFHYPKMLKVMLTEQFEINYLDNIVNQTGLYRLIAKPWNETDLSLTVAEALRRYQQDQQLIQQQAALEQANRLIEINPVGIFRTDRQGRCIYANRKALEMPKLFFKQTLEEDWDRPLHSENHGWMDAAWLHFVEQVNQGNAAEYRVEHRYLNPDHSVRWALIHAVPDYNAAGVLVGFIGSVIDITERKLAELALSDSEQRYVALEERNRAILSAVPDIMTVINAEGQYLSFSRNQFVGELISDENLDLTGQHLSDVLPPDLAAQYLVAIQQALSTGEIQSFEQQIRFGDRIQYEEARIVPYQPDRVLCMVRNISDRKQIELEICQSRDLREAIFNESTDALFLVDPNTLLTVDCNKRAIEMFEADSKDRLINIAGHTLQRCPFTPEELRQIANQIYTQGFWSQEIEYITLNGNRFWGNLAANRISVAGRRLNLVRVTDITERRQAELALQESEARFRQLAETVSAGFFVFEVASFQYSYVNPAYEAIIGMPFQEINSVSSWLDSVHPDDRAQVELGLERELQGEVFDKEYRFIRPDGEWRWLRCRAFPITDHTGKVVRIVGTVDDISDRKQAEIALQQLNEELEQRVQERTQELARSEQDLRTIFNNVYDAIFIHDLDGIILDVNDRALELYDATRDQLLAATIVDLSAPDACLERIPKIFQQVQTGERVQFEWKARRFRTNSSFDAEISLKKATLGNRPVFVVGVRDISDRKQAEAQLREQEQFLRSIYEGVNQPIFVGTILPNQGVRQLGWNPSMARLMGKSSEEVAGKPIEEIFEPDDAAAICQRYAQCIRTKQPLTFEESITFQGRSRWMLSTYNPLVNEFGQVHRVVGTVYDITDRKRLEQELLQINAELERRVEERTLDLEQAMRAAEAANRAKSIFLANMSHELRTPLNAILGFSQLLSRDTDLPPEQQKRVNIINRSGEHLLNLINDILEMSKIEAGRVNLTLKTFDLLDLLKSLEDLFRLKAESKGLRLITQVDADVPQYIQADEGKLRQVLTNLLSNAIKFTQSGSVTLRVQAESAKNEKLATQYERIKERAKERKRELEIERAKEQPSIVAQFFIRFEVADTGPGIDLIEQDLLFEPFMQTQTGQNSQEGTGLGLPISRQFVQLMGSDLTVESISGQGATFRFTIPVVLGQADDLPAQRPTRRVIGLAPNQPVYRLLVVEDNCENRQFLVQLLQSVGFEVQEASNGQEAVARWQQWSPHLIWMDMRMPVMNGYEATRRIRSLSSPLHSWTKILALTASAFEDESAAILAAGCDDLVCKPATETVLFGKIAEHIGVSYVYGEQPQPATAALDLKTTEAEAGLLSQQFADVLPLMPPEWLGQLQQAARMADEELIVQLLEQLPSGHRSLVAALRVLVDEFRLDKLIELTVNVAKAL